MSNFLDLINEKIESFEKAQADIRNAVLNSGFHVTKMEEALRAVPAQIEQFEGTVDDLKKQFLNVLEQIPGIVDSTWKDAAVDINNLSSEASRWKEMAALYTDWVESHTEEPEPEVEPDANSDLEQPVESEEVLEGIRSGKIEEPTRQAAIRRKPGTRPEISLGRYRRAQTALEGGEDSGS